MPLLFRQVSILSKGVILYLYVTFTSLTYNDYLLQPFGGIVAAGSEDIFLLARIPVADVDVDHDVLHALQDVVRQQPRYLPEVLGQELPNFGTVGPESRLELHGPPTNICCFILK